MAIRNTFRRALRRSDSSGSSTQNEPSQTGQTSTAASSESSEHVALHKSSSRLTTWSWGSSKDKDTTKEHKSSKSKSKKRVVHPSERPLTTQNLQHQEMLSHFTMTFGASNAEQIEPDDFMGISPCCTRTPSLCGDYSSDGSSTPRSYSD